MERESRANPKLAPRTEAAKRLRDALESGTPARTFPLASLEREIAVELFLITVKPALYVANVDEAQIGAPGAMAQAVFAKATADGSQSLALCGKVEAELAGLSDAEAKEFRDELGIERAGLDTLIQRGYDLLGLQTYLTAGEMEVRAWTIRRGAKAPEAAGVIHSDLERGFIRAEVVTYEDYVTFKTMPAMRSAGVLRSEGKEYVMREGDVVNFLTNT